MSGPRHAQRHWLQLQARRAVEIALDAPDSRGDLADACPPIISLGVERLAEAHWQALREVARALVAAEMVHRRICELGGEVTA